MIFKRTKYKRDEDGDIEFAESTEVWVADFGTQDLEDELRKHVLALKPRTEKKISWILTTLILLIFVVLAELGLRQLMVGAFWTEQSIYWFTWLWRFILVVAWMYLARFIWLLKAEKMFAVGLISFTVGTIILAIIKIFSVSAAWTWLNLFVEPIWMILIVTLLGSLVIKIKKI